MPTMRRFLPFPLFTLVGLMACSGSNSEGPQGGAGTTAVAPTAGTPTGGTTTPAGGTTVPATTAPAGGTIVPVTTAPAGGTAVPGTTAAAGTTAAGGSVKPGGTTAAGGSAAGGSTPPAGVSSSAGGIVGGKGGIAGPAGASGSAGKTGTAGTTGSAGSSGGGAAGAAGAPAPGSIPTGYPTPTADNYAKCKSSTVSSGLCPGGGAGPVCIECHFGGSAGNYAVTVTLGGPAASQTYVSCEANRGLLKPVSIAAGQSQTYAFAVNVRTKESEPAESVSAGTPGLDMYFSGPTATPPAVSAIGYALVTAATKPIMVWIAGDSTTCDQPGSGFGGWGQMFPEHFNAPIGIANYADSGESSSSFYGNSLLWGAIKSQWTAGDWVFIQFGHNDKGVADATVQANLEKYVTDAQAAKVNAILVSPPARVSSIPIGDQSSLHAISASGAAKDKGVPFVDLTALSTAFYDGLGLDATAVKAKYHAMGTDVTHTSIAGAEALADLVAAEIQKQNIAGLVEYMR